MGRGKRQGARGKREEGREKKLGTSFRWLEDERAIVSFRDLIAWQKGMELAKQVYAATRAMLKEEVFGLISQMRRAAVSVPSNIAEGYGRGTTKDYVKNLHIARGSLAEFSTQFELAIELEMMVRNLPLLRLLDESDRVCKD